MTAHPIWRVVFCSDALPLGESGAEGLSESESLKLYERLVEKVKAEGGSVQLLKGDEVLLSCEVLKGSS